MKIKLVERGFETYTGPLGDIDFVDGESVEELSRSQINRIASSIRVESLDGLNLGVTQELLDRHQDVAEVVVALPTQESLDIQAAEAEAQQSEVELEEILNLVDTSEPVAAPITVFATPRHTEQSLALVADEGGIVGLRAIAEEFGVKGNSIAKIIEEILTAQATSIGSQVASVR